MCFLRAEFNFQNVVFGESLVLSGTSPDRLLQSRIIPGSVALRSKYCDFDQGVILWIIFPLGVAKTLWNAMNFKKNIAAGKYQKKA